MAKLGDFFTIASGGTPDKRSPSYYENGTIPWVKTGDLKNQYVPAGIECITEEGLNNSSAKLFPPNTVLVAMYGATIGACSILTYEAATNQACAAFLPNKNVLPTYLYYFLSSKREQFVKDGVGGAQPNISAGYLKNVQFGLIPMQQQIDIVEKLDKVEKLIVLRKEQLAKLDQLVKSRFIELFGDQKANPFGWPQTTIGDCCTLKSGTSLPADKENEGGRIPYVKVGDMNYPGNEQYITTSSRFVTEQTAGAGIFPVGTVIFPKRGGAIGTNKKRLTTLPICADLNVMGVTAGNALKSQYLMAYFNMVDLGALDNGSSVPQINNKDIAPLVICLPPLALQEQFAAFVEQTDKSKLAIQRSLNKLELLKKALMQEYFG